MKKILSLLLGAVMALSLVGCGGAKKEAISANYFESILTSNGFEMVDATEQFDEGLVESVTIAVNDEYQIEFYVLPSSDQAVAAFAENKANFASMKSGGAKEVTTSLGNYSYYALTTSEAYYVTTRIDNTFIYATVAKEHKDTVTDIIKQLGY